MKPRSAVFVSGSCLNPFRMINKHWDSRSELGKENLFNFRRANPGTMYPVDYVVDVPCGRCLGCRKDRSKMWRVRLLHEHMFGNHQNCICLTLTINQENYAKFSDAQAIKRCIRAFLDRLRYYTTGRKLPKRFFVSELGEDRDRLHFHGFMWDVDIPYHEIRKCWKYGFIWIDPLKSVRQLSYATKYITKPSFNQHKPLIFVSPGLGKNYLDRADWMEWHRSDPDVGLRPIVKFNSFIYRLPDYYKRKMFTPDELYNAKVLLSESERPFKKFFIKRSYDDEVTFDRDRRAMYQTTLRTGKTSPCVKNQNTLQNFNPFTDNADFSEIGGTTS